MCVLSVTSSSNTADQSSLVWGIKSKLLSLTGEHDGTRQPLTLPRPELDSQPFPFSVIWLVQASRPLWFVPFSPCPEYYDLHVNSLRPGSLPSSLLDIQHPDRTRPGTSRHWRNEHSITEWADAGESIQENDWCTGAWPMLLPLQQASHLPSLHCPQIPGLAELCPGAWSSYIYYSTYLIGQQWFH